MSMPGGAVGTRRLKKEKAASEIFLEWASEISDAPETSPSRRRHPANRVLSCLDGLQEPCKPLLLTYK